MSRNNRAGFPPQPPAEGEADRLLDYTVGYWRDWAAPLPVPGALREMVDRSALVLKLLVYQPTGALVAAPTTSLPEFVGGGRNWDYRYTWIRDAAFTLYGLMRLGFTDEAAGFMTWLEARCRDAVAHCGLQVLYAIKFADPSDPWFLATLERIGEELVSDSLVRRHEPDGSDGLAGSEGTFNLCSFWYVEALTRRAGIAEGRYIFDKMLTYANHVGLFAEEIGPAGEALGNFPQAFTHLALISAALQPRPGAVGRAAATMSEAGHAAVNRVTVI